MAWLSALFSVLIWVILLAAPALADKRVALVIGNAAYEHADKLTNPIVDSRAMRDVLRDRLGFQVIYGENLTKRDLERTIGRFATAARGADVAVTYYAGHGSTFGDTPYLVPVDAQYSSLDEMPYELVPLEQMIGELRRAKGIRIAIVDACRDNSAEQALKRTAMRGGEVTRGLAPPRNPDGLIVAYATQYLSTAADGRPGADSPFTAALLKNILTPGLDVKSLFYRAGAQVVAETDGKQRPEIKISLFEDYSLVQAAPESQPTPPIAAPRPPAAPPADELAWSLIERNSDPNQIVAFLTRFPQTTLLSKAEARLLELGAYTDLGNVQRTRGEFDESIENYTKAIQLSGSPEKNVWSLYYYRGISYERSKRWPEAEADFKKALALSPDQPLVLNYLGYCWVDAGFNLDEALKMLRRAAELRPADGYVGDSLGRAYYKLGRWDEAVKELERAVALQSSDPVINDHLGDAYWRAGRKLEAKLRWNRARDLKPDHRDLEKILEKLDHGLDE